MQMHPGNRAASKFQRSPLLTAWAYCRLTSLLSWATNIAINLHPNLRLEPPQSWTGSYSPQQLAQEILRKINEAYEKPALLSAEQLSLGN